MEQTTDDQNKDKIIGGIEFIAKNDTDFMIQYLTGEQAKLNILNGHVFKYFMSPYGQFPDYPEPNKPEHVAKINSKKVGDYDKGAFENTELIDDIESYTINTHKIHIVFDKITGTMSVFDKRMNKQVLNESKPLSYKDYNSTQTLHQDEHEYFFGGGMQNGRFTHKGEIIKVVNTNDWVDGGVTSPCPFYWSTSGYGVLRNTWKPGVYDFGSDSPHTVTTIHKEEEFDAFFFINSTPRDILNDYYELTGRPIMMPEYAFYEAHLNTFNRDYWVKSYSFTSGAILFEDGNYYKKYKPNEMGDKTGILESLNGEKDNYQFSARAMIDRYKKHDVPLAWFLPNDGYGSGYGQTDSLDGDVQNLKEFADYARTNGVEVALWTESQLEPKDPSNPKKGERDLRKEVGVAGTVAIKCDVAWIGDGYSFGLNAVENATKIFVDSAKHGTRPLIIMVDGWAGTQRYAGIWSGDQCGGEWEYIRFHIPTYIGCGMSGQPIVGSDMDGIYSGDNRDVNIRDFQWKTFTPLQLNMDGWGSIRKTPFAFDEEVTAINRAYLKLKSMLMPYNYTLGYEATHGLPMVRAMFLEYPESSTARTKDSQYQFMWGPSILVAPIYSAKGYMDASLRDGIYLPGTKQVWIDFFTGEKYQGGKIYNNIKTPLWKIPVFIKDGTIIPMTNPNNNPYEIKRDNRILTVYPNGKTSFDIYEDDGISSGYLENHFATTKVAVDGPSSNEHGDLLINIHKTEGNYDKMVKERTTVLQIMASKDIKSIKAAINEETIKISKVDTFDQFERMENVYYFNKDFLINPYLHSGGQVWKQRFLMIKIQKTDVTANEISLKLNGYVNEGKVFGANTRLSKSLETPSNFTAVKDTKVTSIILIWQPVDNAAYYDIRRDGVIFTNITGSAFEFDRFKYGSKHQFRIRSVNNEGVSRWSDNITVIECEDPFKYTVKGVKATCNVPCQPGQEVSKLTDGDHTCMWHTDWCMPHEADPKTGKTIRLSFDLGSVYEMDKMEYIPRIDAGNGTILKVQYKYSEDNVNWSALSVPIEWKRDNSVKTIELNGKKMRFIEWYILESVTGFAAGRQILFYERKTDTDTVDKEKYLDHTVKGVKMSCNDPGESDQASKDTKTGDTDPSSTFDKPNRDVIKLKFDLGDVYEIEKIYYPRNDTGAGNVLEIEYRYSTDGNNWNPLSEVITWNSDEKVKMILLVGAKMRYVELNVFGKIDGFESGKQVLFYKSPIVREDYDDDVLYN